MLPINRRKVILKLISEKKSLTCMEASESLNVSIGTIRQDFKELEMQGVLKRIYGGAVLCEDFAENTVNISKREVTNWEVKDEMGLIASELIEDGEIIFMDGSSSSIYVAKHLKDRKNLTVITNAEKVVMELAESDGVKVVCVGGNLRKKNLSYVGKVAEDVIKKRYCANKLFISCQGASLHNGISDASESEAGVKAAMMSVSEKVILLCDKSKFEKIGFTKIADFDAIDYFVTDDDGSSDLMKSIKKISGIEILSTNALLKG